MSDYRQDVEKWRAAAEDSLRRNWLTLAGLFWLDDEVSLAGPGEAVDLARLDHPVARFTRDGDGTTVEVLDPRMEARGEAFERITLKPDGADESPDLEIDGYRMRLIKRGGRLAVRLWDSTASPDFEGRLWYEVDERYRVEGRLDRFEETKEVEVPTALGYLEKDALIGTLSFSTPEGDASLPVFGSEEELFVVFKDGTATTTTYGGGRYLGAPRIDGDRYLVDFNKAFNPPCAVTAFATCSMPRPEQVLSIDIPAGERYRGH